MSGYYGFYVVSSEGLPWYKRKFCLPVWSTIIILLWVLSGPFIDGLNQWIKYFKKDAFTVGGREFDTTSACSRINPDTGEPFDCPNKPSRDDGSEAIAEYTACRQAMGRRVKECVTAERVQSKREREEQAARGEMHDFGRGQAISSFMRRHRNEPTSTSCAESARLNGLCHGCQSFGDVNKERQCLRCRRHIGRASRWEECS